MPLRATGDAVVCRFQVPIRSGGENVQALAQRDVDVFGFAAIIGKGWGCASGEGLAYKRRLGGCAGGERDALFASCPAGDQ